MGAQISGAGTGFKNRIQRLALEGRAFYRPSMKRISILMAVCVCSVTLTSHAQDAATEERLNKLNGYVQDLLEDKANQRKQIENLAREIQNLRDQISKPAGNYASQDDLRKLAEAIKEIDEKREADKQLILKEFASLGKLIGNAPGGREAGGKGGGSNSEAARGGGGREPGYEHVVAQGDTLITISQAYRERGVKVSVDQILKANSGLVPEKMQVGQKIWIPAPK